MNIVALHNQALEQLRHCVVATDLRPHYSLGAKTFNCAFESLESLKVSLLNQKTVFIDVEKFIQISSSFLHSPLIEPHFHLRALFTCLNDIALCFFIRQRIELEGFETFYAHEKAKGLNLKLNSESACFFANYLLIEKKVESGLVISFLRDCMPNGDVFGLDLCEYGVMHQASVHSLPILEWLIAQGGDVNQRGFLGQRPLHLAAEHSIDTTKFLLKNGANFSIHDSFGNLPCVNAARAGNLPVLKFLIDLDSSALRYHNRFHQNLLHHATESKEELELVRYLVKKGVSYRELDVRCSTPLNNAREFKQEEVISYLKEIDEGFSKFWFQLKRLSLQFSLPGFTLDDRPKKLEPQTSRADQTFASLAKSIEDFSHQIPLKDQGRLNADDWKVITNEFSQLFDKLKAPHELDLGNPNLRIAFQYMWNGKTAFDWGHILCMLVSGDELIICDRMADNLPARSGIVVYSIGNKENGKNFLKDVSHLGLAPTAKKDFFSELPGYLELKEKKYYKQKPQKGDNCSYASLKTLFKALIYDVLHKKELSLQEVERQTALVYKAWSHWDKKQTVLRFIESYKSVLSSPDLVKERNLLITVGQDTLTYILFGLIGNMEKNTNREIFEIIVEFMPSLTRHYHSEIFENLLLVSAQIGSVKLVEELVDRFNLGLTPLGKKCRTPLHYAVKKEDLKLVNYFVTKEPFLVNHINQKYKTPLYKAVQRGNVSIAEALLEGGAVVDNQLSRALKESDSPKMRDLLQKYSKNVKPSPAV